MQRKTESKVAEKLGVIGILFLYILGVIGLVAAFICMVIATAYATAWVPFFICLGSAIASAVTGLVFLGFAEICEEIVLIRVALENLTSDDSSQEPQKVKFHSTILDDHIETTKE